MPFLVPPTETMSASPIASAGSTPSAATALPIRAPSTCTSRPRPCARPTNSAIAVALHTRPLSVDWVIDTMRGCEWCTAVRPSTRRARTCGSIRPSSLGSRVSCAPDSRTGPPASSTSTWATSLQKISCHGLVAADSAMMLAAVPVNVNSTSASGQSNALRTASAARSVTGSAP